MIALIFGGQRSGKSRVAEDMALKLAGDRGAFYIATYDNSFGDNEMSKRLLKHQRDRGDKFTTIEEPLALESVIKEGGSYLIDCLSMWILNSMEEPLDELISYIQRVCKIDANVVFVLNSVGDGVAPSDKMSREFIDRCGVIGQAVATNSQEVYRVSFGIMERIK